jgi:hypothetical protein
MDKVKRSWLRSQLLEMLTKAQPNSPTDTTARSEVAPGVDVDPNSSFMSSKRFTELCEALLKEPLVLEISDMEIDNKLPTQ